MESPWGVIQCPQFLLRVQALYEKWLSWAQSELSANTSTELSPSWGREYPYKKTDPLKEATRTAQLHPNAQVPGSIARTLRLLTEIFGRLQAQQIVVPFVDCFRRWLAKASHPFPGMEALDRALALFPDSGDREPLLQWVDHVRQAHHDQTAEARRLARASWKAQAAQWAAKLHRKAFQLLRGQVAPGTESVPHGDTFSSAPWHVLDHHRNQ
jgi:hypothetical protein